MFTPEEFQLARAKSHFINLCSAFELSEPIISGHRHGSKQDWQRVEAAVFRGKGFFDGVKSISELAHRVTQENDNEKEQE